MSRPPQDRSAAAKRLALLQALLAEERPASPTAAGPRRRAERASAPATFAQERLWFLSRLQPDSPVFHIPAGFRLRGPLDVERLSRAWRAVCARHEALRTRFALEDSRLVQHFDAPPPEVTLLRCSDDADAVRQARARALEPFDLATGPLVRCALWRTGADAHLLTLDVHHAIAEVQSIAVCMRDLLAFYRHAGGDSPEPAPLELGFGDFAAWQRERGEDEATSAPELAYWRERLGGRLPSLALPTDHARPSVQSLAGDTRTRAFDEATAHGLRELARAERTTLFAVFLAAWAALLQRYTRAEDVLIGAPMTDRNRRELEGLVGFFVQTLVLRVDLSGAPTFRELVRRAREVVLGAQSHQELPFERLVEALQPDRDLSKSPLFQVALLLQNDDESSLAGAAPPELAVEPLGPLELHTGTSKFDASLIVWDGGEALSASFEYATALFEGETIERALAHLEVLCAAAAAAPDTPLRALPVLPPEEERLLFGAWNDTATDHPLGRCAHELFEEACDRAPEALAVEEGERSLTYGELEARANRLAHRLRALGVGLEDRVALCTGRTLELVVGALAVQKAGGAYVPVDLAYPPDRIAYMVDDAGAKVVLTRSELLPGLPAVEAHVLALDAEEEQLAALPASRPEVGVGPRNLAYVIYTSGSTGEPKGVELEHRGLVNLTAWHRRAYDVRPSDRATHLAGLAFDASVWELWPYITAGASLHLVPEEVRLAPAALVRWLAEHRITQSFLPTPLCEVLLAEELPADFPLRVVLTGGDKLHRPPRPGLPFVLINHYGPTENTVVATCAEIPAVPPEEAADAPAPSIGGPIDNVRCYVLDEEGRAAPIGVPGELLVGGASLARGYHGKAELTAEKFRANPLPGRADERLYATGDLVRWRPDGGLEFLGRIDAQVKVRGFRIELGEVETVLATHPAVREGAVGLSEDPSGAPMLAGYVVPAVAGAPPAAEELRAHLRRRLPDYMVPSVFTVLEALPLTPNGKLDRRALPEPELSELAETAAHVPPEGALEETIAGVWRDVLGRERVGANQSFFELGGQSLLMARVHARLCELVDPSLSIIELFHYPTVNSLAGHITERGGADAGASEARDRGASRRDRMRQRARRRT